MASPRLLLIPRKNTKTPCQVFCWIFGSRNVGFPIHVAHSDGPCDASQPLPSRPGVSKPQPASCFV